MTDLTIEVPATSANLGPGFDTLALAVDLKTTVSVRFGGTAIHLASPAPGIDPEHNLVCDAYRYWSKANNRSLPGATFALATDVPIGRGLGSSAACIVAGLVAAACVSGEVDLGRVLTLAARLEGHPDNVAAAVLGGAVAAFIDGEQVHAIQLATEGDVGIALYIPEDPMPTKEARAVLPNEVPLVDAVFNVSRAACLAASVAYGRWDEAGRAMDDRLHQRYRAQLIPAMPAVLAAARQAGAYGAALSGAGPTLIALSPAHLSSHVASAMSTAATALSWQGRAATSQLQARGVLFE